MNNFNRMTLTLNYNFVNNIMEQDFNFTITISMNSIYTLSSCHLCVTDCNSGLGNLIIIIITVVAVITTPIAMDALYVNWYAWQALSL